MVLKILDFGLGTGNKCLLPVFKPSSAHSSKCYEFCDKKILISPFRKDVSSYKSNAFLQVKSNMNV